MIDGVEYSRRGAKPTAFEVRLVQQGKVESGWMCVARRLIQLLGPEQGTNALLAVLDEIQGEKLHAPCRREFIDRLWRAERDALIRDLHGRDDWSTKAIAELFDLSPSRVETIVFSGRPAKRTTRAVAK